MVLTALGLLLLFLGIGLHVVSALGLLGLILGASFSALPLSRAIGEIAWHSSSSVLLMAIPLFVLLGEILLRAGIADRMYEAMTKWLSWLPGGLMHSNIGASMLFASVAGSSAATAATIGTVATPLIGQYKYSERLFLGSIAAGGTLGILIPPSINLIVYGWLTETSVPALYLAGIVPGVILGGLFMLTIAVACIVVPGLDGENIRATWKERLLSLPAFIPPLGIFVLVVGSIYAGWATPTESASLGVCGALVLAAFNRRLTISMLRESIEGCMRTTSMIMIIMLAAYFLNFTLSAIGLTSMLGQFITSQGLEPFGVLMLVIGFYLVLGCLMEPLPLLIISVPVVSPIIASAGYDLVWFGIVVVIMCEMALITPPVGFNLFVVQGIRRRGSINDVIIGASPFVVTLFVMTALIVAFPQLALWLPAALH